MVAGKSTHKLELDKVLALLREACSCSLGRDLVASLTPVIDLAEAQRLQKQTTEASNVWRIHPLVPLGGIRDIGEAVSRARIGAVLDPAELIAIMDTVAASRQLRSFLLGMEGSFPLLKELAGGLGLFRDIEQEIARCINDDGTVSDQASPELARVRQQIKQAQIRIKTKLDSIIRSPDQQKMLQDLLITIRGDRYVVPVKQEYRGQFPGLIHDMSASGATLFIEPLAVVELNNELKRLVGEEEREVQAVLRHLSGLINRHVQTLTDTLGILAQLDLILAKGKLSQSYSGIEPRLLPNAVINIRQGRHPLLSGQVVPISVHLGKDYDILVITGPNTGGKTVTLKTIGLFVLMAQCGLHLPAETGTEIGVFRQVFVDIGDEQSIEQSLSTFSAHMSNIVSIISEVQSGALVLLDELGAGTDPTEGAALAIALLEYLREKGAKVVATTHYGQLKSYAYNNSRVENASTEFDVESLRPTYRLLVGIPGGSNAFEIARRLGLPVSIIEHAKASMATEEIDAANLIQRLTENQLQAEKERAEATRLRQETARLRDELELQRQDLREKENQILYRVRQEAEDLISRARREVDTLLQQLRTNLAKEAERAQVQAAREAKDTLAKLEEEVAGLAKPVVATGSAPSPQMIKTGQMVEIPRLNLRAEVLTPPNAQGEVLVQAGIMKITVRLSDLRITGKGPVTTENNTYHTGVMAKAASISPELDLRGKLVDEALELVEKYLDDALLAGLNKISLIHGKGTGALRAAIQKSLKQHPHVKAYRLGNYGEGGAGVTVVELEYNGWARH